MSPGTSTGWPGNARVAPLRWTMRRRRVPSTSCSSSLAMLWATSYTTRMPSSRGAKPRLRSKTWRVQCVST